ncbi:MAG: hypothetical protein KJ772_04690 [Proteobacteria bacterium]|nr:hypothetical protein [Pseudomonadota bacterium]
MRNMCRLSRFVPLFLLLICLAWPAMGNAAQEFYFEGSPDRVLPDSVPPAVNRQHHPGPKAPSQGPAAWYGYDWKVKTSKGSEVLVILGYTVYEPLSTRYGYAPYTKSNTMAAFLDVTGATRYDLCPNSNRGNEVWTLRGTSIDNKAYLQTCSGDVAKMVTAKAAPQTSYTDIALHNKYSHDKSLIDQRFYGHYGNVAVRVEVKMTDGSVDAATIGHAALSKLSGKVVSQAVDDKAPAAREEAPPPAKDTALVVEAMPSLLEVGSERTALIPASELLPAKLTAKTEPGAMVTFEVVAGKSAELRTGSSKGARVSAKADSKGMAEALFFYTGETIKTPAKYEVRITTPGHKESVKVLVGLGLAFDRIVAVKADRLDTHAFTLSLKSRVHPGFDLANYLYRAHQSGLWGDRRIGIKLKTTWVNAPAGVLPEPSFQGTTRIIRDTKYANVLTVASGEPQYYQTSVAYPAVVMQSDGKHVYRVHGGIVLLDTNDKEAGFIREGMEQSQALAIVARDTPEHWLTSLACSLEAQDEVQYLMLETAKMLPGGDVVDALTTATGLMCKFGQGEYESLFYDLGTLVGGKYLDHLNEPDVLKKLTPKQQEAAKLAKKAYDDLDEYKQREERDKWLGEAGKRLRESKADPPPKKPLPPPAPASSGQDKPLSKVGDDVKKSVEDLQKSFEDMGKSFKNIFK